MSDAFSHGLLFPAITLAFLAWLVPKLLSLVMPEGMRALLLLTFFATFILFAISSGFFLVLYLWNGMLLADIAAFGWIGNILFFGKLGSISALIWAPIMVLSVAGLPRNWTRETW